MNCLTPSGPLKVSPVATLTHSHVLCDEVIEPVVIAAVECLLQRSSQRRAVLLRRHEACSFPTRFPKPGHPFYRKHDAARRSLAPPK